MPESTKERRLRFESEGQYRALRSALVPLGLKAYAHEREHGAFLFASPAGNGKMNVVDLVVLEPDDFTTQTAYYLEMHDDVLQEMIVRAHRTSTVLIEAHSHPFTRGPRVRFSPLDCKGLADIGPHVSWRLSGRPYVALVFGRDTFDSLYWEGRERKPQGSVDLVVAGQLLRASRESERFWEQDYG